jgi:hypothetical protein
MISLANLVKHHAEDDFEKKCETVISGDLLYWYPLTINIVRDDIKDIKDVAIKNMLVKKLQTKYPKLNLEALVKPDLEIENEALRARLAKVEKEYNELLASMRQMLGEFTALKTDDDDSKAG